MPETNDLATLFGHTADSPEAENVVGLAQQYLLLRQAVEGDEETLKRAKERLLAAEVDLIREMERVGVKSLKVEYDGATVGLTWTSKKLYKLPSEALENGAFFQWLLRAGGQDLVKRTIHHATFNSFCKELVEEGKNLFPGLGALEMKGVMVRKS